MQMHGASPECGAAEIRWLRLDIEEFGPQGTIPLARPDHRLRLVAARRLAHDARGAGEVLDVRQLAAKILQDNLAVVLSHAKGGAARRRRSIIGAVLQQLGFVELQGRDGGQAAADDAL